MPGPLGAGRQELSRKPNASFGPVARSCRRSIRLPMGMMMMMIQLTAAFYPGVLGRVRDADGACPWFQAMRPARFGGPLTISFFAFHFI